jgi:type IV pilus assembly protein PilA
MENRIGNTEGFTLVELMVVVGIVGIMSSIAVPSYQAFTAKARQTEAKILLSSIYSLERSFQIENETYTTCLASAGFDHGLSTKYYYAIGFTTPATTCGGTGTSDCHFLNLSSGSPTPCTAGAFPAGGFFPANAAVAGAPVSFSRFKSTTTTSISSNQFKIAAAGSISSMGATIADVWTIDETRTLAHVQTGI